MTLDLTTLIDHPAITGFIVFLLANLLPADRIGAILSVLQRYLEKWPILGVLLKIVRKYIETTLADADARKVIGAGGLAEVLVGGAEQLKKIGTLDSPTAAAQVTKRLQDAYGLDEDTARMVTEKAVADLNERKERLAPPLIDMAPVPVERDRAEADLGLRR